MGEVGRAGLEDARAGERGADPRESSGISDIASGTGEPGLSIAAVIPGGRVVLADLSGGMLAAARERGRAG
jgi:ubiquinone/menaquinone biosynthesis C-methylase UbiE